MTSVVTYFKAGLVAALATIILPIQGSLWAVFTLVCLNAAIGVLRAWRAGEKFCGKKLLRSVWFAVALGMGLVATQITAIELLGGSKIPMLVVTGATGTYLLSSILNSLGHLSGSPLFRSIDAKLKAALQMPSPPESGQLQAPVKSE